MGGDSNLISYALDDYFNFNPHLRVGGDYQYERLCLPLDQFQSPPPHGEVTIVRQQATLKDNNFNPHLCIGGDGKTKSGFEFEINISIHTSV